ncbi:MAG TPA: ISL3 family transposase [Trebonia sp.]
MSVLLPHLAGLDIESVTASGGAVRILARACARGAACTGCGTVSRRVHSRYARRLADTASGGQEVVVGLQVRRFFCDSGECGKKTFAEQVPGLTARYGRRTSGLDTLLRGVAMALGGRAGARLAGRLACAVSRSTLIRIIRAAPDPDCPVPLVLGVDDFALRKGHVYGTVLVDIETRRPVDMLPERSAESFRTWLDAHPGAQVICRDRGGCYAEGAAAGAPRAVQVADRWHLWHNLAEAVERAAARHRSCLQDPPPEPPAAQDPAVPESSLAARTRERHAQVRAALDRGLTHAEAGRTLGLDRKTVRRYASAADASELVPGARLGRPGLLGPHQAYLRQRWDEGARSTQQLHQELRDRGYRGSLRTLRRLTAQMRQDTAVPKAPPPPPARKAASWILTLPADLADDNRAALARITARCPELKATRDLVRSFADMLCRRRGAKYLQAWASAAEASEISELRSFAKGLRKDWAAVTAGVTLPYSSGAVEGHVNRIKMIKRQMYGRAKPDLLRKRVLLAD